MMDQLICLTWSPRMEGLLQSIQDQACLHGSFDTPSNDLEREHVDNEGDVSRPPPRTDVGEVADPKLVRCRAWKFRSTLSSGQAAAGSGMVVRTFFSLFAPTSPSSRIKRSTVHLASSWPFAHQIVPYFACAVELTAVLVVLLDQLLGHFIAQGPRTAFAGIALLGFVVIIGGGGQSAELDRSARPPQPRDAHQ